MPSGGLAGMADQQSSGEIASLFGAFVDYTAFVEIVRISLPEIDRVLWPSIDLSYAADGRPTLRGVDFDAAREIHDLMWDRELGSRRAVDQLDGFITRLDQHIAARIGNDAS